MMYWHRLCALIGALLIAYIVVTGAGIQLADIRALLTHASETDPDMLMMRQHIDGPPNYAVVSALDYTALPLPTGLDYQTALSKAAMLGRTAVPGADLRLVELRIAEGKPAAHVQMGTQNLLFDLATGARCQRPTCHSRHQTRFLRSVRHLNTSTNLRSGGGGRQA